MSQNQNKQQHQQQQQQQHQRQLQQPPRQQQQQQHHHQRHLQQWHAHASASMHMFTGTLGGDGGFDLEMGGRRDAHAATSATFNAYSQHQLQQVIPPQNIKMEPVDHILSPTIEMEELIIKTEPSDDSYKINLVDDNLSYMHHQHQQQQHQQQQQRLHQQQHHHQHQQQQQLQQQHHHHPPQLSLPQQHPLMAATTKLLQIKQELPTTSQQKPLNFPRRKLQTERSDTLPICQRCKQVFLKKHSYTKHVAQSVCDIVEYDFKCCICPMSFMSNEELQAHEQLHSSNNFFCHKYCGKFFDKIELCEAHEYMQHDYVNYVCNICSAIFASRDYLFAHLPQHKHQQRFDCSVCRLWFHTPHELHQHRLAAPYFCGKYYAVGVPTMNSLSTFAAPNLTQQQQQQQHQQQNYNLQDCRMGVMEVPSTSVFASTPNNPPPYQPNFSNNSFQLPHPIKSEFKGDNDFFSTSDFQPPQNFSDYTNDSYASSHNSMSFNSDFNDYSMSSTSTHTPAVSDGEDAICCVPKCGVRKSTSSSLQFFTFPKDGKYLHQWLHNLKMCYEPHTNYADFRICSLHFPKRCINRYSLCYWAVPTFNLGHDDVANLYQNREITNTFTSGENARCSMPGCNSQRGETNLKFYNFPKETKTLIKWCQNARLSVYGKEQRHFCSRHFEERCFGKFRLKPWAVPTLYLGTPYGKIHDNPGLIHLEEKKCCLPHCRRARSSDFNLSLYRFPRDEVLLRRWCYNLRLDPAYYRGKNHKICSAHFVKEALGLRKLSPGAVPTMNLGHNDSFNIYENELCTPPPPPPPPPPSTSGKIYKFHNTPMHFASISASASHFATASASATSTSSIYDTIDICSVPTCKSNRHTDNVTLHTIPRRAEQMRKWCHNLKMEPEKLHKGVRICSEHFEAYCIGGCMRPFAVPTLNLGHDDPNIYKNPDVIKKLNIRETCCVRSCKRNRDRDHANLHRFPSNIQQLEKWCSNLQKPVPDGTKLFNDAICEVHFEDRCLRNKRLEKWAIPTLNLGHEDLAYQLPSELEVAELWGKPLAPNTGDEEGECCVDTCRRNPQIDDIKLYRTPEDADLLVKWAHNLQSDITDLPCMRICNLHFESHCIGKRLHGWAIPTLNLGKNVENLYENPEPAYSYKKEKHHKMFDTTKAWTPRCCLSHCRKMRGVDQVQLFRFPHLNRSMLAKWCHNLQVPIVGSTHRRLCSVHFEPHVLTKRCPMPQSVPTLDLNTPPGYKIYQNPARLKLAKVRLERVCVIPSCRRTRVDGVQLFRYPNNRVLLRKWCHNTRQKPNEAVRCQYRVCSQHFEPHSFGAKRLCPGAIPTLKLGYDDADIYANEAQSFAELQCVVNGCDSVKEMEQVRLFKFPCDDEDLLWKWSNNLKMNPVDCQGVRICNRHFEPDCMGPKLLYKWSIPTLELGHDDAEIELVQNPRPEERYTTELIFKCCVPTCGKTRKYDEAQMNSFPKHIKYFRRWKHNLKLEYLDFKEREKYKICNDHFEEICLGKTRLHYGAIPTLNLGHDDTGDLYQVDPEQLQSTLFGKVLRPCSDRELGLDKDNDDENSETTILPDTLEVETKCAYPDCSASKTLLREPIDLPTQGELLALWCKHMQVDQAALIAEHIQPKLCGLHFMQVYQGTLVASEALLQTKPELEADQESLRNAFERCGNSLVIQSAQCSVAGCDTNQLSQLRLYTFPYNRELVQKWSFNTGIEIDEHRRHLHKVCSAHFEPHCLTESLRLRAWAIPTLHLQHSDPSKIHQNPDLAAVERRMLGPVACKCCVPNCGRDKADDESIKLFLFPTDEALLEKWAHNLKLEREKCPLFKICALHFEPHCFGHARLRSWAIPTLQLGHSDPDIHENPEAKITDSFEPEVAHVKMKKSLDSVKCCVSNCRKSRLKHGVRLFPLPAGPVMMKKWCHNLQLPMSAPKKHLRICNLHFHKRCIDGKQLRPWAVPTMQLGFNQGIYENPKNVPSFFLPICCLPHCDNRRTFENNLRTFGFPKDPDLQRKWRENLNLPPEHCRGRVCIAHFEPNVMGNRKLKVGAVPTLNLGYDEEPKHNNRSVKQGTETNSSGGGFDTSFEGSGHFDDPLCVSDDDSDEYGEDNAVVFRASSSLLKKRSSDQDTPMEISPTIKKERTVNNISPICCLKHCRKEKTPEQHLATFGFPKSQRLLQKWSENLKLRLDECVGRVCIEHFELHMVGSRRLRNGAVPTLKLGHNDELRHTNNNNSEDENETQPTSGLLNEDNTTMESINMEPNSSYYADRLSHSVFRLCCLKHCRRKKTADEHLRTFGFPKDKEMSRKWSENLKLPTDICMRGRRICMDHFEPGVIGKMKLHPGAVPTLLLGHNEEPKHKNSELTLIYVPTTNNACNVVGCGTTGDTAGVLLFRFPQQMKMVQKWCDNLQLKSEMCGRYRICSLHFEARCVGKRLCSWAIPTLQLGHADPPIHFNPTKLTYSKARRCCIETCRKRREKHKVHLFSFPKPSHPLARKWYHNTKQLSRQSTRRICSEHFAKHALIKGRPRPWAVPTLNLGHNDPIFENPPRKLKEQRSSDKCCIRGCLSTTKEATMHSFPKRCVQLRKWAHNTNQDPYLVQRRNYKVCGKHFEPDCYEERDGVSTLRSSAMPTLHLGDAGIDLYTPEISDKDDLKHARCAVSECESVAGTDHVKFFAFPTEVGQLEKWRHNLQLQADSSNPKLYICSLHFETVCIQKHKLHALAMPTLQLGAASASVLLHQNEPELLEKSFLYVTYCCVSGCGKSKTLDGIRMNRFPKSRALYLTWTHNLKLQPSGKVLNTYKVCDDHFEDYCKGKMHLNVGAIPTLKLGHDDANIYRNNLELLQDSENKVGGRKAVIPAACAVSSCTAAKMLRMELYAFPQDKELRSMWCSQLSVNSATLHEQAKLCAFHFIQAHRNMLQHLEKEGDGGNSSSTNPPDTEELDKLQKIYMHVSKASRVRLLTCSVPGCDTNQTDHIKLMKFPINKAICERWEHNTKIKVENNRRYLFKVCALHFEERCYANVRLRPWAVPTLRLNHSDDIFENPAEQEHTQEVSEVHTSDECCVENCSTAATAAEAKSAVAENGLDNGVKEAEDSVDGSKDATANSAPFIKWWSFPSDEETHQKWCHNLNVQPQDGHNLKVCSQHFEPYCISGKMQKLRIWAIPTLKLKRPTDELHQNPERDTCYYSCCIANCRQTRDDDAGIKLYSFPKNDELFQKWVHNVRLDSEVCRYARICTLHFEKQCIGKKLYKAAVPTLDLGHNELEIFTNPKFKVGKHLGQCSLSHCGKRRQLHNVQLYTFPENGELLEQWRHNLNIKQKDVKNRKICSEHFEARCMQKRGLKPWALPTVNLGHTLKIFENPTEAAQQEAAVAAAALVCSVPACSSKGKGYGLRYYNFPSSAELLAKWCSNLHLEAAQCALFKICSLHFSPGSTAKYFQLVPNAIPTLRLGHDDPLPYENPASVQGNSTQQLKCCIPSCQSSSDQENTQLFRFPKVEWLREKWCHNARLPATEAANAKICSLHFEPHTVGKTKPRPWALPTVLLGHQEHTHENPKLLPKYHQEERESGEIKFVRGSYCAILSCFKCKDDGIQLYKYPRKGILLHKWADNCKHYAYQAARYNFRICGEHFEANCFNGNRLRLGAIPTLKLGHDEAQIHRNDWRQPVKKPTRFSKASKSSTHTKRTEQCSVTDCGRSAFNDNVKLFKFPEHAEVLEKWCHNLKRSSTAGVKLLYICNMHFEERCIKSGRLLVRAIPTLLLGHIDADIYENPESFERPEPIVRCCVPNCGKSKLEDQVHLSAFPKPRALLDKWAHNLKIKTSSEVLNSYKVCCEHFESYCYEHGRLKCGSIPTLKLGHDDTDIYQTNKENLRGSYKCNQRKEAANASASALDTSGAPAGTVLACTYADCTEITKGKARQVFDLPKLKLLKMQWLESLDYKASVEDALKADLKLCPVHYKITYDKNVALMKTLEETAQLSAKNGPDAEQLHACLKDLQETYETVSQSSRVQVLHCAVPGCNTNAFDASLKLYNFPYNADLLQKWCHNTKVVLEQDRRYIFKVCTLHFEPNCFMEASRRLRNWSIPTLKLPPDDTKDIYTNPEVEIMDRNTRCGIDSCLNAQPNANPATSHLYGFPKDPEMYQKWLQNTQLTPREAFHARICSLHFEKQCINKRLRMWAVPTLLLGHDKVDIHQNPAVKMEANDSDMKPDADTSCVGIANIENVAASVAPSLDDDDDDEEDCLPLISVKKELLETISTNETAELEVTLEVNHTVEFNEGLVHQHFLDRLQDDVPSPTGELHPIYRNTSRHCRIAGCKSHADEEDVTLHKFPMPEDQFQKWKHNTQIQVDKGCRWKYRICNLHFEPQCFRGKRLLPGTMPTINLGEHSPDNLYTNECVDGVASQQQKQSQKQQSQQLVMSSPPDSALDFLGYDMTTASDEDVYNGAYSAPNSDAEPNDIEDDNDIDDYNDDYNDAYNDNYNDTYNDDDSVDVSSLLPRSMFDAKRPGHPGSRFLERNTSRHCRIEGCYGHADNKGITLHKFPIPEDLFKKWMHNTQIDVDKKCRWRYRICSRHFEPGCFRGRRFLPGTMPTLHLGPNQPATIYQNEFGAENNSHMNLVGIDYNNKSSDEAADDDSILLFPDDRDGSTSLHSRGQLQSGVTLSCAIPSCGRQLGDGGVHLHRVPHNSELRRKWLQNCRLELAPNETLYYTRICTYHFERYCLVGSKRQLKFGSIPTLHLGHSEKLEHPAFVNMNALSTDRDGKDPERNVVSCSVAICGRNTRSHQYARFFPFPNIKKVLAKWLYNLRMEYDTARPWDYQICDIHFDKDSFDDYRLHDWAVPTLFLGHFGKLRSAAESSPDWAATLDSYTTTSTNSDGQQYNEIRSGYRKCCLIHCQKQMKFDNVSLYKFPSSLQQQEKWSHNLRIRYDAAHPWKFLICSEHFEVQCGYQMHTKKLLYKWAVPTLNLGKNAPAILFTNENAKGQYEEQQFEEGDAVALCEMDMFDEGCSIAEQDDEEEDEEEDEASVQPAAKLIKLEPQESNSNAADGYSFVQQFDEQQQADQNSRQSVVPMFEDSSNSFSFNYDSVSSINKTRQCCLTHCQRERTDQVKLFRVPQDANVAAKWEHNLQMVIDETQRNVKLICSTHFEPHLIGAKRLMKNAVPTINLGHDDPNIHKNVQVTTCHCHVPGCARKRLEGDESIRLFQFPLAEKYVAIWEERLKIDYDITRHDIIKVCDAHFEPHFLTNRYLALSAVPTLNLPPLGPKYCHVPGCVRSTKQPGVYLYTFPQNENFIKIWSDQTQVAYDPKRHEEIRICDAHFESVCVINNKLSLTALPTLHLPSPVVPVAPTLPHITKATSTQNASIAPKPLIVPKPLSALKAAPAPLIMPKAVNTKNNNPTISSRPTSTSSSSSRPASTTSGSRPTSTSSSNTIVCSVPHCSLTNARSTIKFFNKFPDDFELFTKWCFNLKIDPRKYVDGAYHICSEHFEPSCIGGHSLREWAVPTINLGHDSEQIHRVERPAEAEPKCCLPGCGRKSSKDGVQFFNFPKGELYKVWCQILKIDEGLYRNMDKKICSAHFLPNCYLGTYLKPGVMPTLNLCAYRASRPIIKPKEPNNSGQFRPSVIRHAAVSNTQQQQQHQQQRPHKPTCIVPGCNATEQLYKFPDNRNTSVKWCHNLKINYATKLHRQVDHNVCHKHFEPHCLHKGVLHVEAVPTLHLAHKDNNIFPNKATFASGVASSSTTATVTAATANGGDVGAGGRPSYDDNSSLRTSVSTTNTYNADADVTGDLMDIEPETYYSDFENNQALPQSTLLLAPDNNAIIDLSDDDDDDVDDDNVNGSHHDNADDGDDGEVDVGGVEHMALAKAIQASWRTNTVPSVLVDDDDDDDDDDDADKYDVDNDDDDDDVLLDIN